MINKLFVYGTLAPGKPNQHILSDIEGSWEGASVKGSLRESGWGAEVGYPGILLDGSDCLVAGLIFTSNELEKHWKILDDFEGSEYRRVVASAKIESGELVEVYVYELNLD